MRPYCIQLYLIVTLLLLSSPNYLLGQDYLMQYRYNEVINLINNYGHSNVYNFNTNNTNEINSKGINGFIFNLAMNSDSSRLETSTPRQQYNASFKSVCDSLYNYCRQDTSHVLTLFFKYDFDSSILLDSINAHPINKCVWKGDFNQEWPTLGNLVSRNKQIICFGFNPETATDATIKYLWQHAASPCLSQEIEPRLYGEFCKGKIQNKLLYLSSYQTSLADRKKTSPRTDTNQDPFFISHTINTWKNTGKVINFLIFDQYDRDYRALINHIKTQRRLSGTISYNRQPLDKVFWEGDFNAVTYGEYSFPFTLSDDIHLRPVSPGFRFVPEEVNIEGIKKAETQNFIAVPLDISDNMTARLPFDEEIKDEGPFKFKIENKGGNITKDRNREDVLLLDGKSYMSIGKADDLGISNSDFTVSAWIKLARENTREKRDFSILGTQESYYRGGLHLQTRDNRPYFGFFSNDLWGNTHFVPNKWYHVVWRYNKYNQEQAIYVNGKKDVSSLNHPPFVSNSDIFIGRSISQRNLFEGKIDDLIIWNRTLGEEEIWNLYQDVSLGEQNNILLFFVRYKFWLGAALFAIVLLLLFSKRKNTQANKEISSIAFKDRTPTKNTIKLFGEFQVIDKNGEDITGKFTPRLKQIFIYLIIKSKKSHQGVTSVEFINEIWPSFDRKKAINNRGVSISKLRHLLELMDTVTIANNQERWRIDFSGDVYCDYYDSLDKIDSNLFNNREKLNSFLSIVQRGAFLFDCKDNAFDEEKGNYSNKIIDILTRLLFDFDIDQNPDLVIKIADRILAADDLNEEALKYKIKALIVLRQANQAKFLFKSFKEKHKEIYEEDFSISFEELLH